MSTYSQAYENGNKNWNTYKDDLINSIKRIEITDESSALLYARSFCFYVMKKLWKLADYKKRWECRELELDLQSLSIDQIRIANELGNYLYTLPLMECSYQMGNLYTMLLPDKYRSKHGIYYTPPQIAERLLDLLTAEGADWAKDNILDPACGGGAFIITVANRILGDHRIKRLSPVEKIVHIEKHLEGMEIDGFAGWITQVLLDILLYEESAESDRRIKNIVRIQDTIKVTLNEKRKFNVIVGNPPYSKVTLDDEMRRIYGRSLFGHANLYGLFIDASLRLRTTEGLIGFVTPTSFLGGQYFSNLRRLLVQEAPPLDIDFVSERSGVFDEVLQETCLAVFGNNVSREVAVNKIYIEDTGYRVQKIGSFKTEEGINPWIIAREVSEAELVDAVRSLKTRLNDYGYKVSTGQLVWNRLKDQFVNGNSKGVHPVIWAEAISSSGAFSFDYQLRKKLKYFKPDERQDFLLCRKSAVLVQRTTSKEQNRRLLSCVLPQDFIDEWDGVIVENHVNIAHTITDNPGISVEALSLVLNTKIVDRLFRCISGSVAVSANELHSLPLPPVEAVKEIDVLIKSITEKKQLTNMVESMVVKAYLGDEHE